MYLSLIKRFLSFIKSIFPLKLILIAYFLSTTLKLPFKFFLMNLDLMVLYPLVIAVSCCVVALTISLLKNRSGLSVKKSVFIFTFSLFLSQVISYVGNCDCLSVILSLITTYSVYPQILCIEDASSTKPSISDTGQGSVSFSWLQFSVMLGTRAQDVFNSRLVDLPPNTIPSFKVSLAQVGVKPGTPEWDRITEFANGYNGDDKKVTAFCNTFKKASASNKPSIIFYSLSTSTASVQSKILDAISKGL